LNEATAAMVDFSAISYCKVYDRVEKDYCRSLMGFNAGPPDIPTWRFILQLRRLVQYPTN
jgi:hypothetical protein